MMTDSIGLSEPMSNARKLLTVSVGLLLLPGCRSPAPQSSSSAPVSKPVAVVEKRSKDPGIEDSLAVAATKPSPPLAGEGWHAMFDPKSLAGWSETRFAGRGETECASGLMVLNMGDPLTGL